MSRPTAVLGLGNVLMKDDALGPYVIRRLLASWRFPPDVAVEDLGTPGRDLQPYLADREALSDPRVRVLTMDGRRWVKGKATADGVLTPAPLPLPACQSRWPLPS